MTWNLLVDKRGRSYSLIPPNLCCILVALRSALFYKLKLSGNEELAHFRWTGETRPQQSLGAAGLVRSWVRRSEATLWPLLDRI